MKSPIFIFSLPRSGSTLLQRVLMSHEQIASVAEPWILLPFFYAIKKEGVLSEYSHINSASAINDFIEALPNKKQDFNCEIKNFFNNLYAKQCTNDEMYFLDKTPRYYLIINEIAEVFPDAKFIFLFRNPIQIFSSIISTFGKGSFKQIYGSWIDLKNGMEDLSLGYKAVEKQSIAINYETFISQPEETIKNICNYLELNYDESMLQNFSKQKPKGKKGDPTGVKLYKAISKKTLSKWHETINSKFRVHYLIKHIKRIDNEIFEIQGYNKEDLLKSLKYHKPKKLLSISDLWNLFKKNMIIKLNLNLFFSKSLKAWSEEKYLS